MSFLDKSTGKSIENSPPGIRMAGAEWDGAHFSAFHCVSTSNQQRSASSSAAPRARRRDNFLRIYTITRSFVFLRTFVCLLDGAADISPVRFTFFRLRSRFPPDSGATMANWERGDFQLCRDKLCENGNSSYRLGCEERSAHVCQKNAGEKLRKHFCRDVAFFLSSGASDSILHFLFSLPPGAAIKRERSAHSFPRHFFFFILLSLF